MLEALYDTIVQALNGPHAVQHILVLSAVLVLSFVLGLLFGRTRSKSKSEFAALQEQIDLLQKSANQLDDQVATVHTLNEKIKLLEAKNQSLRNDLSRAGERSDNSAMLETKVKSQEQVIATLQKEIDQLKTDRAQFDRPPEVKAVVEPTESAQPPVSKPELRKVKDGDDFKKIEGVGPKIEQILKNADVLTYADLINTGPEQIKSILVAYGPQYKVHDPTTWPQQAQLALDSNWEELYELQVRLKGGKQA